MYSNEYRILANARVSVKIELKNVNPLVVWKIMLTFALVKQIQIVIN